jgi:hypothetical protein
MIFTNANLIDQATLIRAVRVMLQQIVPSANPPHDQVLSCLNLACADLDAGDPLKVLHILDVSAYRGQTDPIVPVTTRHYGAGVIAVYVGDTNEANQVTFSQVDALNAQIHARLDHDSMAVLIRWPRQPHTLPYSDRPLAFPSFPDCKSIIAASTGNPGNAFDTDGVKLSTGDRVLACLGKDSAAIGNGVYVASVSNFTRATDCDAMSEVTVGKCVRVLQADTYQDTVWQIVDPVCVGIGTSPIFFQQLTYPTNIDADQAGAHVIPRAAAYLALQLSATLDKATATQLNAWATAMLARPIVAPRDAISHRLQTGTAYASA